MRTTLETTEEVGKHTSMAGKYLTFRLGEESYGVSVTQVREIISMMGITHMPQMPPYVLGIINLRGKVVPVIDLRLKFGMTNASTTPSTCIVVVKIYTTETRQILLGMVVDAVEEVANIDADNIEDPPSFGTTVCTDYILGMAKIKDKVKTLLKIDRVITEPLVETPQERSSETTATPASSSD